MTIPVPAVRCSECGARCTADTNCRTCFEGLLAFEAERPDVFAAVHHLTVATYFLQHPTGYTESALVAWRALLADSLDGRATPGMIRRRLGERFAGAARVAAPGAPPPPHWPTQWPFTVRDVFDPKAPLPDPSDYVACARSWAAATRAVLESVKP